MIKNKKAIWVLALLTVVNVIALFFFYFRYVPFVKPFQQILVPLLSFVLVLTSINSQYGTLFFIFVFPLINSLPYFFGIYENIPHAPTALVLFLFYFLGFLLYKLFHRSPISLNAPISKPLLLFSTAIFLSGVITFLRYSSFYPFLSDRVYELTTSAYGVTAGGAIMSVVFFSLTYLTGFGFYFVFVNTAKSRAFIVKALILLCLSALISLSFGLFQHLKKWYMGNTQLGLSTGLINATFKDALSFGAFLAMFIPLAAGVIFACKGLARLGSFALLVFSFYMVFFSGSKSGFLSIMISLTFFLLVSLPIMIRRFKGKPISVRKANWASYFIIVCVIGAILGGIRYRNYLAREFAASQTLSRTQSLLKQETLGAILQSRVNTLWKMAVPMIKDYPLSGVGIGGYIIESSNYAKLHSTEIGTPESAENYILQVGSELGLVGVILVLWILWEIIKQIRRTYLKIPPTDNYKFVFIGAIAGIVSFLLMIQTHTFIGSYEIKYTFWLLVGIIFCLGRTAEGKDENVKPKPIFNKTEKIAGFAVLLLFSAVHLWNSTHSLSLKTRTELLGIKQDFGFYQQEKTDDGRDFRWTREYGGQTIKIEKPVIEIPLLASHPDIQQKPVKVKVYLVKDFFKHKKLLGELILNQGIWKTYDYEVPGEIGQELILLVKVNRTWNPLKAIGTPDPRNLGVAVGKIEFKDKLNP